MKSVKWLGLIALGGLLSVCLWLFISSGTEKSIKAGPYLTTAPYLPEIFDFCGEEVPLSQSEVKERFDRELISNSYYHSNTILTMKRAHKFFPIIEPILSKYDIPDDFKYLCVIESNLSNVVSPAGAAGFWQFLSETARGYGLEINSQVDERYHLEKATEAACKYLKEAYNKFGSWTLAAASYNMGMNGLESKMMSQRESKYYDLLLYQETQRYVFRILAVKAIFSKPQRYGFHILDDEKYNYPDYKVLNTNQPISCITCFAKDNEVSYKELKWMNPWIRSTAISNKNGKVYTFKILRE